MEESFREPLQDELPPSGTGGQSPQWQSVETENEIARFTEWLRPNIRRAINESLLREYPENIKCGVAETIESACLEQRLKRHPPPKKAYFLRIIHNQIAQFFRREGSIRPLFLSEIEPWLGSSDSPTSQGAGGLPRATQRELQHLGAQDVSIETAALRIVMSEILEGLKQHDPDAFAAYSIYVNFEDFEPVLTFEEVARQMNKSDTTAHRLVREARNFIRAVLHEL